MFGPIRAFDIPLTDIVRFDLARSTTLHVALAESAASDVASVTHCHIQLTHLFSDIVASLSAVRGASGEITAQDNAVVATVAAAVVGLGTFESTAVPANRTAAITRVGASDITVVPLTVDDALVQSLTVAFRVATVPAAAQGEESKTKEESGLYGAPALNQPSLLQRSSRVGTPSPCLAKEHTLQVPL